MLVKLGYITDDTVRKALAGQLGIPFIDLDNTPIDRNLGRILNRNFARRHVLLPVAQNSRTLTIAMDDPTRKALVEDINSMTGQTVTVATSSAPGIQRALRRLYDDERASEAVAADPPLARTPVRPAGEPARPHTSALDDQSLGAPMSSFSKC